MTYTPTVGGGGGQPTVSGYMRWQSTWSGATAYQVGDCTRSGGASYVCILAHTNQVPPNATYWEVIS